MCKPWPLEGSGHTATNMWVSRAFCKAWRYATWVSRGGLFVWKNPRVDFQVGPLNEFNTPNRKTKMALFRCFLHGEISALLAKYELFWKDAKTPGNAWDGGVAISVFVAPNSSCCNPLTWKMINSVMQKYQGDKKTHYRWWFQIFFTSTNICQMGWNHC